MWIFVGAGLAVLTALADPDGSITGFATAIVFIAITDHPILLIFPEHGERLLALLSCSVGLGC